MPPVGFESTISAGERPQTYALDRAATGIGFSVWLRGKFYLRLQTRKNREYFAPPHPRPPRNGQLPVDLLCFSLTGKRGIVISLRRLKLLLIATVTRSFNTFFEAPKTLTL